MKWVIPWLVCWPLRFGTRDLCPALAVLVDPVQNMFFLSGHYFTSFVPIAKEDRQEVVLRSLSHDKSLCL
jgi:hypothetical protein